MGKIARTKSATNGTTEKSGKRGRPRKVRRDMDLDAVKPLDPSPIAIRLLDKYSSGQLVEEFFTAKEGSKIFKVPKNDYEARDIFAMLYPPTELRYVEGKGNLVLWYRYRDGQWQSQRYLVGTLIEKFIRGLDEVYRLVQQDIFEKYAEIERKPIEEITNEDSAYKAWVDQIKKYMWDLRNSTSRKHSIAYELLSVPSYRTEESQFDADPYLLNVANGTVDMRTSELKEHDPNDLCRKIIDVPYVPSASSKRWTEVVEQICCGDLELMRYLQKVFGYSGTGVNREKYIFLHFGDRDTGKTLCLKTHNSLYGEYATAVSKILTVSGDGRGGGNIGDYVLASLHTKRLGYCSETGRNDRLNADRVKMISGGDTVQARHPYGSFFCYEPCIKVHVATNHMPDSDATDEALWDRLIIIPYQAKFEKIDKTLGAFFQTDEEARKGILAWVVEGAKLYFEEGIDDIPKCCIAAKEAYRFESDEILQFIEAETLLGPNSEISGTDLYAAYQEFMQVRMRGRVPLGRNKFYLALEERSNSEWRVERGGLKNQLRVIGLSLKRGADEASSGDRTKETLKRFIEDRCRYDLTVETELTVLHEELGRYCADLTPGLAISRNQMKEMLPKIGYLHEVEITAGRGRSGRPLVQLVRGIGLKEEDHEGQLAA